jgi:hypothetical protein
MGKVIIQQVDLDTTLTALLLGVSPTDQIICRKGGALPEELVDPSVLCIEAGGSGEVSRNNFDHHDTTLPLPPACRQALDALGRTDPALRRLVDYVVAIDIADRAALGSTPSFPTLSDVFSGMRLSLKDPVAHMEAGLSILATVLHEHLDAYAQMPERPEWKEWIIAKRREKERLAHTRAQAELFRTSSGAHAGYLQTDFIGAPGVLYGLGCSIAIAYSSSFGDPPIRKYTIGGNGVRVDHLLPFLNALEPGWGGPAHGTIIASPRTGSSLEPTIVKRLVREHG